MGRVLALVGGLLMVAACWVPRPGAPDTLAYEIRGWWRGVGSALRHDAPADDVAGLVVILLAVLLPPVLGGLCALVALQPRRWLRSRLLSDGVLAVHLLFLVPIAGLAWSWQGLPRTDVPLWRSLVALAAIGIVLVATLLLAIRIRDGCRVPASLVPSVALLGVGFCAAAVWVTTLQRAYWGPWGLATAGVGAVLAAVGLVWLARNRR
jgi:hypothetical protein